VSRESAEQRNEGGGNAPATALLAELNGNTDLAALVERVARTNLPSVVVPALALAAWEERDSAGWAKVSAWLRAKRVTIIYV
jgi:hypothetical protein